MVEFIGWLSGILFALCSLPQFLKCKEEGNATGVSSLTLWMWLLGEVSAWYYVYMTRGIDLPLHFNYTMNLIFLIGIFRYKLFPRKEI